MARFPDESEVNAATAAFEPYYKAVGKVVHAWNGLQEQLAIVFCRVTNIDQTMGLSVWHSANSDRAQRQMLKAALSAVDDDWHLKYPKGEEDIRWLLSSADALAEVRNNVIHAPCSVALDDKSDFEIIPFSFHGNRRAKALRGKVILDEFCRCEANANRLKGYARWIDCVLSLEGYAWPDRPVLS
ncbi:hypothetical protein [Bradyrhizobium erythrophlei]|jgi:hypothetical protein|uniref:Uncharacterized protein n=1 Tax=Bradyrhizobium erythrophlei TaxID=1437360 RepID=A0A1M7U895_9BRAD|nr:hypothetical protein [Bradyrhizobium erythrophlei]SHN79158.1 hypothetical protein SAMN05444170_3931 [Bradyrhizobium erythrophlei]